MCILTFPDAVPRADTIDVLILRSLAEGGTLDSTAIAKMWGEDEARVRAWLVKFVKQGIVATRVLPGNKMGFNGHRPSIISYIESAKNRAG